MSSQKKNVFLAFCFYLFIAVILPAIWFKDGLVLAGGETGLPLYSPERTLRLFRFVWQEISVGFNAPAFIPEVPFVSTAVFFIDKLGLSSVFFQAALFGFLLFSAACSMFYLSFLSAKNLKNRVLVSFLAGIFYLLNPFVIINVWQRFLYPFFFFLPLLPLTLALFIHGLRTKQVKFVFFISLASFVFSCAFSSPPLVATLWIPLGCYFLFYLLKNRKQSLNFAFAIKFFLVTLVFWLLANLWWIFSLLSGGSFFSVSTMAQNLASLRGVSQYHVLKFVIRLLGSYFLFDNEDWGPAYKTIFFQLISWITPLIVGLTVVKKRKDHIVCFFGSLAVLTLFLAKGTSPPFGEVFAWLFTKSFFFGVFRNPFEKAGLLLAISYSFLFGVGLGSFYSWIQGRSLKIKIGGGLFISRLRIPPASVLADEAGKKEADPKHPPAGGPSLCVGGGFIFSVCFLTMGVYLWPVWTGQFFGGIDRKVTVEVPNYYQEANQWLNNQQEDFRTLSLPTRFGDGIFYNWPPSSYRGAEPSCYIFDLPVVASGVVQFAEVFRAFSNYLYSHQIWKMMSLFSAKYVLSNKDVDYQKLGYDSPEKIKEILEFIKKPSSLDPGNQQLMEVCGDVFHKPYAGVFSNGRFSLPVCKIPKGKQDWSKKSFLRTKVTSDRPVFFELVLIDKDGDRLRWDSHSNDSKEYVLEANQQRSFIIPLYAPTEGCADFDYQKVQELVVFIHNTTFVGRMSGLGGIPIFDSAQIEIKGTYIDQGVPQKTENIRFEKSFGKLDFYKLEDKYFVPRIYATNQFLITHDVNSMFEEIEKDDFIPGKAMFFLQSQEKINRLSELNLPKSEISYQPKVSFKKINPTKYEVKIEDASQPFFLVFNETYHPSWELFLDGEKTKHFLVNGYANGYYADMTGDLDLVLEFLPQRLLKLGSLVSGFSMVFLCGLVICFKIRENRPD